MICSKCQKELGLSNQLPTCLVIGDREVKVTPIEAALLEPLVENINKVVPWSVLYERAYDTPREGLMVQTKTQRVKSLRVVLCRLRRRLRPLKIENEWGRGMALRSDETVRLV